MADYLSAGVYVEEVATAAQVIPGVTTSNMGIVGYAARGPANVATLVQSYEQYSSTFGGLVRESYMPLSMAAFFANGGRRAYVVRVPPADAVAADAKIQSVTSNSLLTVGDGSTATIVGTIETASGASPVVAASVTVNWRESAAPVVAENARNADDSADLALANGQASYDGRIDPAGLPDFDPRFDAAVRGTVSISFDVAASAGGPTQTITVPVGTASIVSGSAGNSTNGALASLDHRSGRFSLRTFGNFVPAVADAGNIVTVDYTPASATLTAQDARGSITVVAGASLVDGETVTINDGTNTVVFEFDSNGVSTGIPVPFTGADTAETVRDSLIAAINAGTVPMLLSAEAVAGSTDKVRLVPNSSTAPGAVVLTEAVANAGFKVAPAAASTSGIWVGDVSAAGSLNYSTGVLSIPVTGFVPHVQAQVLGTFTNNAWDLNPISVGAWGNDLRIQMAGSPNYFNAATGSYSRYDLNVLLLNSATNTYSVVEQYEELVFNDPSSAVYFPDVINELSDYITVTEPAGDVAPGQLNAVPYSTVLTGGSALSANKSVSGVLSNFPIQKRTVSIAYTSSAGTAHVITDNGAGVLVSSTGALDGTAINTISYTTGAVQFVAADLIKGGTLVVASYRSAVAETVHTETFGAADKNYVAGEEGTFDSANWGRDQFTNAVTLEATSAGMYAFNKVDEILQVVIPDFAGNSAIAGDQLDYAAVRAAAPHGGDRFIILTTPAAYTAQEAVDWFRFTLGRYSDYAALYWPWVRVLNPLNNNRPMVFPPMAHIAGVYARTDNTKNVGKSPGGTVDGALNYLVGLETVPTQADRDIVYPNKVNPLISGPQTGLAVWGVRTISNQPDWRYINARRLFMFLEKSVYNSTWWAVFENNGPALWAKVTSQISSFLGNLFSQGYFAGNSPSQAFFVVCDSSNNTSATIEAGQVIIDIGVAPNKPAEFVRLRFQQKSLNS